MKDKLHNCIENKNTNYIPVWFMRQAGRYLPEFREIRKKNPDFINLCLNIELVKSLGADKVIDYTKEDFTKNGESYDVIFDTVGKSSFTEAKKSLTKNGKFLTTFISWSILFQMLWTSKFGNNKAEIAFTGLRKTEEKIKDLNIIKELIEAGKLHAVIDKTYKMEQAADAHFYVDSGHKKGNVVLTFE